MLGNDNKMSLLEW